MRLVVLDRDGVINEDSDRYVRSLDEWRPIPGSLEAIAALSRAGYTVAVATNQSALARGFITEAELARIHARLIADVERRGGRIAHLAWCPHGPDEGCACRKPLPGLIDRILEAVGAPPDGERWMVGDSPRDLEAGAARGCRPVLVRTGKGATAEAAARARFPDLLVADDLAAVAAVLAPSQGRPATRRAP